MVRDQTLRRERARSRDKETEELHALFGCLPLKAHQGGSNFKRFSYETVEESWKAQEQGDDGILQTEETN